MKFAGGKKTVADINSGTHPTLYAMAQDMGLLSATEKLNTDDLNLIVAEINKALSAVPESQLPYRYIFVSESGGSLTAENDGSSASYAVNSIAAVNTILSGLTNEIPCIFFERGGWYYGQIDWTDVSGTATQKAKVAAYGEGADPVLDASIDLSALAWVDQGGNIWKASVSQPIKNVWKGNVQQTIARESAGYYSMTEVDFNAKTLSIPDLDRPSAEVVGAKIRCRMQRYYWTERTVVAWDNDANVLTFSGPTYEASFGDEKLIFLDGLPVYLSEQDEWCYDPDNNEIYVYSTTDPSGFADYRGSAYDFNIDFADNNVSHISIKGLDLKYAGLNGINSDNGKVEHFTVQDCQITYAKKRGVHIYIADALGYADGISVHGNKITYCGGGAVYVRKGVRTAVYGNETYKIFSQQPYGFVLQSEFAEHNIGYSIMLYALLGQKVDYKIHWNNILDTGMGGILCYGEGAKIKYNNVDVYATQGGDCGGLYCYDSRSFDQEWAYNRVVNGIGGRDGFTYNLPFKSLVIGLYFDKLSHDCRAHHNIVENIEGKGVLMNRDTRRIQVDNNYIHNAGELIQIFEDDNSAGIQKDCVVTNNVLSATFSNQICIYEFNKQGADFNPGYINNNIYVSPHNRITHVHEYSGATVKRMNLYEYQKAYGRDLNSTLEDVQVESIIETSTLGPEFINVDSSFNSQASVDTLDGFDNNDVTKTYQASGIDSGAARLSISKVSTRNFYTTYYRNAKITGTLEKGEYYLWKIPIKGINSIGELQAEIFFNGGQRFSEYFGYDPVRRVILLLYYHVEDDWSGDIQLNIRYHQLTVDTTFEFGSWSFMNISNYSLYNRSATNLEESAAALNTGFLYGDGQNKSLKVFLQPMESAFFQYDGAGYQRLNASEESRNAKRVDFFEPEETSIAADSIPVILDKTRQTTDQYTPDGNVTLNVPDDRSLKDGATYQFYLIMDGTKTVTISKDVAGDPDPFVDNHTSGQALSAGTHRVLCYKLAGRVNINFPDNAN